MSVAAAGKALAQAGIDADQVGCIMLATVTHPLQTPSAAADVAHRLGTTDAAAFDISAACAGFCYGVSMANDMVRGGSAEYVARHRLREALGLHRLLRPLDGVHLR